MLAAVESLRAKGAPVELDLIEGVPNAEARLRYAAADIVVDQLRVGWYGMLAIESMALAKPVVVHLDEQAAAETEEAFGLALPLVRASETDLEDVLAGLIEAARDPPRARPLQPRLRRAGALAHGGREAGARDLRARQARELVEADRRPREPAHARPQREA